MIIETFKEKRSKLSVIVENFKIDWFQSTKWKKASYNTLWCLMGCAIGDLGTIAYFQVTGTPWSTLAIMSLAIIMGLRGNAIAKLVIRVMLCVEVAATPSGRKGL